MTKKIAKKHPRGIKVLDGGDDGINLETYPDICGLPDANTATEALIMQAANTASNDMKTPVQKTKQAVGLIDGIRPTDAVEGMLAVQMSALHNMAMACAARSMQPNQTFEGCDMNMRHAAKLMNAFTHAVEVLDKHRGKGQTITVKHQQVTVESGAQAVIGDVNHGGGSK